MSETLDQVVPHLWIASRQGIIPLALGEGEALPLPFRLNGAHVEAVWSDAKGVLLAAATRDRGVAVTRDGGLRFAAAEGLPTGAVEAMAGDGGRLVAVSGGRLHGSDDGGRSFRPLATLPAGADGSAPRVRSLALRGQRLAVATDGASALESEDGGRTLGPAGPGPGPGALVVAMGPEPGGNGLWVGGRDGLWRREGGTFRRLLQPHGRPAVTAIVARPGHPAELLAGAARRVSAAKPGEPLGADAGIYRSEDGGQSWREVGGQVLPVMRGIVTAIVFLPSDPSHVLAGASSGEVFESRDGGATWRMAAATLPGVLGFALAPAAC